jgi:hypothetical protein
VLREFLPGRRTSQSFVADSNGSYSLFCIDSSIS